MGTSASLISTGVFFRKALFAPQPSTPSYSGPPPPPPPQGPIEDSTWRPSRVAVLTLSRVEPPAGQAGRRSGRARLKRSEERRVGKGWIRTCRFRGSQYN